MMPQRFDLTPDELTQEKPVRMAKCGYCGEAQEVRETMANFVAQPELPYDKFYCGCGGWN